MIISAIALKVPMAIAVRVHHVRKAIVRRSRTVAHAHREIARKVIVRLTRIVVLAPKGIVPKAATVLIKIVARVHHAHLTPTRPNSAAGMCPTESIQAHA